MLSITKQRSGCVIEVRSAKSTEEMDHRTPSMILIKSLNRRKSTEELQAELLALFEEAKVDPDFPGLFVTKE